MKAPIPMSVLVGSARQDREAMRAVLDIVQSTLADARSVGAIKEQELDDMLLLLCATDQQKKRLHALLDDARGFGGPSYYNLFTMRRLLCRELRERE